MAVRAYEPKAGSEGLVIETFVTAREIVKEDGTVVLDRQPGETFAVGTEETPWPYATANSGEQAFLDEHPLVKRVAANQAESLDPLAEEQLVSEPEPEVVADGEEGEE